MNLLAKWRYWIAEPLIERLRAELLNDYLAATTILQAEAYELGYKQGAAQGELRGQQMLLAEFGRIFDERHAAVYEITEADLERARKGILH